MSSEQQSQTQVTRSARIFFYHSISYSTKNQRPIFLCYKLRDTPRQAWGRSEDAGLQDQYGLCAHRTPRYLPAIPSGGDPALSRWLRPSSLKDQLWPTVGHATTGTSCGLVAKALHNPASPHPERTFCHLLSLWLCPPVLSCHHTHIGFRSPGATCLSHFPLPLPESDHPSMVASEKRSPPLPDLTAHAL